MKLDSSNLELIEVRGIPIRVHWSFVLILGYVAYINYRAGNEFHEIIWSLIYVLAIFICVTLHELGHALAALKYGIQTKSITLYPIGGVAALEKIPEKPLEELWVALAGPLVNVIISSILWTWIYISPTVYSFEDIGIQINSHNLIINLAAVNIIMVIFNLLPAFPMDGGRVFRSLLSLAIGRMKATYIAMLMGQIISVVFVIWGFMGNPFLIFIGIFIFFGAAQEYQMVKYGGIMTNLSVKSALMTQFTLVKTSDTLADVMNLILKTHEKEFIVINSNGDPIGIMTRELLIQNLANHHKDLLVKDCYRPTNISFFLDTPLYEAFKIMQTNSIPIVPVIHHHRMVGVITIENIIEYLMMEEAIAKMN